MSCWPDGRRAAVSLTFDNLGEAAEIQLGLRRADDQRGGHWSVVVRLPIVLEELAGGAGGDVLRRGRERRAIRTRCARSPRPGTRSVSTRGATRSGTL